MKFTLPQVPVRALAIEGGGVRVVSALGALVCLEHAGRLDSLEVLSGSSSGALPCVLRAAGWTFEEMYHYFSREMNHIFEQCFAPFQNAYTWTKLWNVARQYGVSRGDELYTLLGELIARHVPSRNPDATLGDLRAHTGIAVLVPAACYTDQRMHWFSPDLGHADMPARTALIASMRFPLLFTPVQIGANLYLDGGLVCNYPLRYIDHYYPHLSDATIGLEYEKKDDVSRLTVWDRKNPPGLTNFAVNIISMIIRRVSALDAENTQRLHERTFIMPTDGVQSMEMPPRQCLLRLYLHAFRRMHEALGRQERPREPARRERVSDAVPDDA